MDHQLQPVSNIDDDIIPAGFTKNDPNSGSRQSNAGGGAPSSGGNDDLQKQAILEQALTPEALERLRRIKLVKEKNVIALENTIVSMAMSGKLPGRINEGKLVEMLERRNTSNYNTEKGKVSIQRKKYAFDSDDDDNDDDLM